MSRRGINDYPSDWATIAARVKAEANDLCIRCHHPNDPQTGHTLTVHHLDMDRANCRWWNLVALCQRCHLSIQARVILDRPWVMTEHSEWFKPYVAGYYAFKYLGMELNRETIMSDLEFFLGLEAQVVLGGH